MSFYCFLFVVVVLAHPIIWTVQSPCLTRTSVTAEGRSRGPIPHSPIISEEHMAKWINRRHPLSVIAFVPALRIHWCCGFDTPQDNGGPQLTDIVCARVCAHGCHWHCWYCDSFVSQREHSGTLRGTWLLLLVLLACKRGRGQKAFGRRIVNALLINLSVRALFECSDRHPPICCTRALNWVFSMLHPESNLEKRWGAKRFPFVLMSLQFLGDGQSVKKITFLLPNRNCQHFTAGQLCSSKCLGKVFLFWITISWTDFHSLWKSKKHELKRRFLSY